MNALHKWNLDILQFCTKNVSRIPRAEPMAYYKSGGWLRFALSQYGIWTLNPGPQGIRSFYAESYLVRSLSFSK